MDKAEVPKHIVVRQALTEAIWRGDYKPGDRLPAERDLAETHGVSYMMARRAITEMSKLTCCVVAHAKTLSCCRALCSDWPLPPFIWSARIPILR